MPSRDLSRTTYRDPTLPTAPIRSGESTRGENALDMDDFYRPLFEVHASGMHDWGVGEGLGVSARSGSADVTVLPGVALDVAGRHISLASGGDAEIGAVDPPPIATLAEVSETGVVVPTAGMAGTHYLVVRWHETFDTDGYNVYGVYRYRETPWLRFMNATGFSDDGTNIVLAEVTIDAAGHVTGMSEGLRREVGISAETIQIRRAERLAGSPDFEVGSGTAGNIRPRSGGGLEVAVADSSDRIDIEAEGGGVFNKLAVAADRIVARRSDGKETVTLDGSDAWLRLGTRGVEGDLVVKDANDRTAVNINGETASVHVGTRGNEGDITIRNNNNHTTVRMDGQPGDIHFGGRLKDTNSNHIGITYAQLRDLIDGGTSNAHSHEIGSLGYWGNPGTKLGIIGGGITIESPYLSDGVSGSALLDFSDHTFSPSGFPPSSTQAHGHRGNFTATPHAIVFPRVLHLSTRDDTFFGVWASGLSTTGVRFDWDIDTKGGWQQLEFLVIGPI